MPKWGIFNAGRTLLVVWQSGLMDGALPSGSRGPGSSPGGDIVLCSWARNFTLTVPLSTQVYKLVRANLNLGVDPGRVMLLRHLMKWYV